MIEVAIKQQLRGLTLDVAFEATGGVTSIFGPSGAGKTSILRAVAGLSMPERAHMALNGRDLAGLPAQARNIGYVFQDARLFPHMSVQQNMRYGGHHDEGRIIEMLDLGALLPRMPRHLSGGEAQRVAIGRALMRNPDLLLLDEPMASLDAARKAAILPYLEALRDHVGVPILHVSHDLAEVTRLATTLVLLDQGKVVGAGPLAEMLGDPAFVPYLGPRGAGAVITARRGEYDSADDLTTLRCSGGDLVVPGQLSARADTLRLRIPAQDVILATTRPEGLSALNVLPVTVAEIAGEHVVLQWGDDRLLARVTARSVRALGLGSGQSVFAIVKATAMHVQ